MKICFTAAITVMLLFFQSIVFGVNDAWVLGFFVIVSGFILVSVDELHVGNRQMLRAKARDNSRLYKLLSKKRNPVMMLLALISSMVLSVILLVMSKGLIKQHGVLVVILTLFFASLLLSKLVTKFNPKYKRIINNNLAQDIALPSVELIRFYYAVLMLNMALALFFSAYDTYQFAITEIDLLNLSEKVLQVSIIKNEYNHYSRALINLYLLIDHIKIALAKHMFELFDFGKNFYGLYVIFVLLNTFKLFGFSISFVLLHKRLHKILHQNSSRL